MKHLIPFVILIFGSLQLAAQTIDKIQLEKNLDSILKPFNIPNAPGVYHRIAKQQYLRKQG